MIKVEIDDSALLELYDVLQECRVKLGISSGVSKFLDSIRRLIAKSVEDANGLQQQALLTAYERWERLNKERISALEKRETENVDQTRDVCNDHEHAEMQRKAYVAEGVLHLEHDEMVKDNDFFYPKTGRRHGNRRGPPPPNVPNLNKKFVVKK